MCGKFPYCPHQCQLVISILQHCFANLHLIKMCSVIPSNLQSVMLRQSLQLKDVKNNHDLVFMSFGTHCFCGAKNMSPFE